MRSAFALIAAIASCPAFAACIPAEVFSVFLERYSTDLALQRERTSIFIHIVDQRGADPPRIPVKEANVKSTEFLSVYGPFPDRGFRNINGLNIELKQEAKLQAVRIYAPNSDSYDRTYLFRQSGGCWRLTTFSNNAL
jgi:hypothetical protein